MTIVKRIVLALVVLVIAFIAHTLITTGFFRTVENKFEGSVLKKIALPGAEDIMVSQQDSFALISSTDRAVYPPQEEEHGGLYYVELKTGNFNVKHLTASFEKPFAPHGISMFKKDSTYTVMAISHTANGHSIEVFELIGDSLIFTTTLTNPAMVSPNDLVLVDENRFYFTNDHGYTEGLGKVLEEYGGLSVSNVVYFDGTDYKEVAYGIGYANGINYDPTRNMVFVASPRKFLVKAYTRNQDNSLDFVEDIDCGTGVDNIEIDKEGNLWIGAHPNLLHFQAYAAGKKEASPSEIIKINYKAKDSYSVERVYTEDGKTMSASTIAVPFGDLIFVGNVMDDQFLVLKKDQ